MLITPELCYVLIDVILNCPLNECFAYYRAVSDIALSFSRQVSFSPQMGSDLQKGPFGLLHTVCGKVVLFTDHFPNRNRTFAAIKHKIKVALRACAPLSLLF